MLLEFEVEKLVDGLAIVKAKSTLKPLETREHVGTKTPLPKCIKSKAPTSRVPKVPPRLAPLPHQLNAETFAHRRLKTHLAVYLALDPGLGKTIVSCLIAKAKYKDGPRILFVSPPGLIPNVQFEFKKWCPHLTPRIVGDSTLHQLEPAKYDLVFVDEAHRFANEKTLRSKALHQILSGAAKVIFLSGTPSPNTRPIELWPILRRYAPDTFGTNFFRFAKKYCDPEKVVIGRNPDGSLKTRWRFTGFSNQKEFKARLYKSFMLRMRKDVIDLPEKREGLLVVGKGLSPSLGRLDQKLLEAVSAERSKSEHLAKYLRLLGVEKLRHVFPFIDHLVYETKESVIFFVAHKEVAEGLAQYLAQLRPIVITGATPQKKRAGLVKKFQDGKTRFAVLNIQAAGLGHNMTRADREVFVEFSWRPGDNDQASDRAHRIGRTKPVLVQYVVLKGSYDAQRMQRILTKRQNAV